MNDVWDMLSEPFPPEELQWRVEALSKDKRRALVVPYVDARIVLDRLDEVVGTNGWQDNYVVLHAPPPEAAGNYAVKCRLTVMDISKEDVGEGDSFKSAFSDALMRAAVKFGVGRFLYRLDKQWVDHDPDTGKFNSPRVDLEASVHSSLDSEAPAPYPGARADSTPSPAEAKPEPQELIDRLIERLKEAGLGKQAAQIVMRYGGYGKHPDETRKLYGELRALLKGQAS
ncbi:Rad52/Rad22 family DNA repair protein [uncultured Meiothermus sp.]|jgi:hypothetical protein|uniref:Rad52/Rad22 family DNA repair protein n=1 Tax=uncultured Meiothermus sp. TaxID=157471 RepID=UPI002632E102|nr:Rad52/Rad22 family DNA repair protein [uncultured Meiothermus sp.]